MKTLIRLLLQEQSDPGLHCLHICHFVSNFSVQNFRTLTCEEKRKKKIGFDTPDLEHCSYNKETED